MTSSLLPLKPTKKQKLNAFVESLAQGKRPRAIRLDFWIYQQDDAERSEDGATRRVSATLPRSGSLLPLFAALGLATAEELLAAGAEGGDGLLEESGVAGRGLDAEEADLLEWLASAARSAAAAGGRRAALAAALGAAAADAAVRHGLSSPVLLSVDCGPSASRASLSRALKAVRALEEAMALFGEEEDRRQEEREGAATEEEVQSDRGDENGDGDSAPATSGKPFSGLRVRLYTPPGPRRKDKAEARRRAAGEAARRGGEEGERGGSEDEGAVDDGGGDADADGAAAWVSPSDGSLCVLLPRRCSSPSPALFLRALRSEAADLPTARALSAAREYWRRRAAELSGPTAEALGVERVSWFDDDDEEGEEASPLSAAAKGEQGELPPLSAARRFVSWAAAVLGEAAGPVPPSSSEEEEGGREEESQGQGSGEEGGFPPPPPLARRRLSLSVVVHSDEPESVFSLFGAEGGSASWSGGGVGEGGSPSPSEASSSAAAAPPFRVSAGTLHVSAASAPATLLSFLRSEDGAVAALAAEREAQERARLELEMEAAALALGAAAVVRVSPSASLAEVAGAARRLAASAPLLAAAGIDLSGEMCSAGLALPAFFFSCCFLRGEEGGERESSQRKTLQKKKKKKQGSLSPSTTSSRLGTTTTNPILIPIPISAATAMTARKMSRSGSDGGAGATAAFCRFPSTSRRPTSGRRSPEC